MLKINHFSLAIYFYNSRKFDGLSPMRKIFLLLFCLLLLVLVIYGVRFFKKCSMSSEKKLFNIVLVGAAGSGKGTQADIIKNELNLLPISAGEALRQYRQDPNAKYTKTINEYIDKGMLVPVEITNEIIGNYVDKHVFCKDCKYSGVIFDGYPRQIDQLTFLDEYLSKKGNKIDAVVYIDVPMEELVERLSGRFACSQCGELYHKKNKPTKVAGVCDKCGGTHFTVRDDDKDEDAIRTRFKIFEESTKNVLETYQKRGIVLKVNGSKLPREIADEIITKLKAVKGE